MKLKRMAATMMAIMAMATSVAGMSASAAMPTPDADINYSGPTGTASFGTGGTAEIYLDPTKGTAGTRTDKQHYIVHAEVTGVWGDTVTGQRSVTVYNTTYCSTSVKADNRCLSKITTYHSYKDAGTAEQGTSLTRTCTV